MSRATDAFRRLLEVLDLLEVRYHVGGSVASSVYGLPRTTLDVDLVVDLKPGQIDEFVAQLGSEFYADPVMIRESFLRGRAANLIHLTSAWKFDLFPLRTDEYSASAFGRRVYRAVSPDGTESIECAVATAEDTILRKLEWYRAGGEVSERQWNDLRGICESGKQKIDTVYLRTWAPALEVEDLLERLLAEFGM